MKSEIYHFLLATTCSVLPLSGNAQESFNKTAPQKSLYINIDWQANGVIGSDFVSKISGWGAHLEAGYYRTENFAVGGFLSYHTNNEYIPYQSFIWENEALSIEQQHSVFQIPFGVSARYRLTGNSVQPYVGTKIGAQYTRSEDYINRTCVYQDNWGFYISPEIGVEIYPFAQKRFGLHLACYYSFATNEHGALWYHNKHTHNYGFRTGITF